MKLSPSQRREIASLAKSGNTIESIARRFNCHRKTVSRWAFRGQNSRETFADASRSGRPRELTQTERARAKRLALGGYTAESITRSLNQNRQDPVAAATVRRCLGSGKDPLLWVPISRGRVLSERNKGKRREFCRVSKHKQCGAWVYGDSKLLYLCKDRAGNLHWKWAKASQLQEVVKGGSPYVLHFYAFVSRGYKSPLFFVPPTAPLGSRARKAHETYKASHFIELLPKVKRDLVRAGKFSARNPVVLDHAKQHAAVATKAAIQAMELQLVDGFPAQSWDINIIENVWGALDGKLQAMRPPLPRTPDGWRRRVQEAWKQVSQSTIDKLVSVVPARMALIEQQGGAWLFPKKSK